VADLYQTGVVTTLHCLKPDNVGRMERDLESFVRTKPIGLVLPALSLEFETPAMARIAAELRQVRYLQRIVVALGRATQEQYASRLRKNGLFLKKSATQSRSSLEK